MHEQGARAPSLRRLHNKHPYFTNGSAPELASVLTRARFSERGVFYHGEASADATLGKLDPAERQALLAFLDLL